MLKITDFGEHVPGARKDRTTPAGHRPTTGFQYGPLSETWPAPDWKKAEAEHGRETSAWLRAARDELRTPDALRSDRNLVRTGHYSLVQAAGEVLSGKRTPEEALAEYRKKKAVYADQDWFAKRIEERARCYAIIGHEYDLRSYAIRPYGRKMVLAHQREDRNTVLERQLCEADAEGWEGVLAARLKFAAATRAADRGSAKAFARGCRIMTYGGKREPPWLVGRKRNGTTVILARCGTYEEARRMLRNEAEELQAKWKRWLAVPGERPSQEASRTPPAERRTCTPAEFDAVLPFRGVQWGNHVALTDRPRMLGACRTGCGDLAKTLDWPLEAVALGGTLAVAFGSRGKGGSRAAMAHYEPVQRVINLTKNRGAGSFAHEWFHALDAMIGEGTGYATAGNRHNANSRAARLCAELGTELRRSAMAERSAALDRRRGGKPYWASPQEMAARGFEAWTATTLAEQGIENTWLVSFRNEEEWNAASGDADDEALRHPYPYPLRGETARLAVLYREIAEAALGLAARRAVRQPGMAANRG